MLKSFTVANAQISSQPFAETGQAFGFPGANPMISANGTSNGIVWVLDDSLNGTGGHPASGPAVLHAYDATTLTRRHVMWARFWAERGAYALVVDSFGPRGLAAGFAAGTHAERPPEVDEVTVRPLDAYGALRFLARQRGIIDPARIGLQGWSNGGSATLATMSDASPCITVPTPATGFRGALVFYPACALKGQFPDGIKPYAPVRVFQGSADEEVSPKRCAELVAKSRAHGGDIEFQLYPDATHDFDDPGTDRRSVPANVAAANDAFPRAANFFATILRAK